VQRRRGFSVAFDFPLVFILRVNLELAVAFGRFN
jgi:hypothetical protein